MKSWPQKPNFRIRFSFPGHFVQSDNQKRLERACCTLHYSVRPGFRLTYFRPLADLAVVRVLQAGPARPTPGAAHD